MELKTDGLTPQHLQTSRKNWWDDTFTRLLLDYIPLDTKQLVEIDCGLAGAAHVLLPSLPDAQYLGFDFHAERLAEAKAQLEGARIGKRVQLKQAQSHELPLVDGASDVVLSIMSMQHHADVSTVLTEILRVLRRGGRLLAVEPDNLGQRFYFNGSLEEISTNFHALCLRARVARQPADLALGPRLPSLMMNAGFQKIKMLCHMVNSTRLETANAYFNRLRRIAHMITQESGLAEDNEQLLLCEQAIRRCLFADLPKRLGFSCHIVPVFLSVGVKI